MKPVRQSRKLYTNSRIRAVIQTAVLTGVLIVSNSGVVFASLSNPVVGGTVFSTGFNTEGRVGMGDEMYLKDATQAQLPVGLTVVSVARGIGDTWILASDGQVYGSGYNESGELGDGTSAVRDSPVKFQLPGGLTAVSVSAHNSQYPKQASVHVIASDGNVYSAGYNSYGELGDGSTPDPNQVNATPTKFILPGGVSAVEVETTTLSTYVRGDDGNVYASGYNQYGQLGDGTTTNRWTPVQMILPGGVSAQDIVTPKFGISSCIYIIGSDGKVYAAGQDYGKFGHGTSNAVESTPVEFLLPGGVSATKVIGASQVTTVLADDGNVYSAGANYDGQLGDGTSTNSNSPVQYLLPPTVTALDVYAPLNTNSLHVLASDGYLYSSGYNDYGRFGLGSVLADDTVLTPTAFPMPGGVSAVGANVTWSTILVVGDDGAVYGAGYNNDGELGDGTTTERDDPVAMNLPVGLDAASIYQNESNTGTVYLISTTNVPYALGLNDKGQVGNGTLNSPVTAPQQIVLPSPTTVVEFASNVWLEDFASFVGADNNLYSVGYNLYGQAASGTVSGYIFDPEEFVLPTGVKAVQAKLSNGNMYVLGSDSQVYGAGDNFYGQLGDGTRVDRLTPVKFQLPAGVSAVTVFFPSGNATSVLASDGQIYSAGNNGFGSLGIGAPTTYVTTPMPFVLPGGVTVKRISETYGGTSGGGLARNMSVVGSDNVVYTAGGNSRAQIGNANPTFNVYTPEAFILPGGLTAVKVHNMDSITAVEASDGNVYLAGTNTDGQLGNGTFTSTDATATKLPTLFQLPVGVTVARFDGTPTSSHVIGSDLQLYGAGDNTHGELGDASLIDRSTPVLFQLPGALTVRSVDDIVIVDTGFGRVVSVVASDDLVYSAGFGPEGSGAPNSFQSTPLQLPMPGGLTVKKLVTSYNTLRQMSVIASNDQYYVAGSNTYGQLGDGTTTDQTSLVRFQLPAGVNAVQAIPEYYANIVLGSDGKVYVAGLNSTGWLGGGDTSTRSSVTAYNLPAGTTVSDIVAILGNQMAALSTPFLYGVGSHTYCDANENGTEDSGESMVNGQTVSLYQSVGGVANGAAIDSYTTASYQTYEGTFFFDNLPPGEYILGLATDSGTLYSDPFVLDGAGDGWILGNSAFIQTVSAMGQTGFVCGASIVLPPGSPSTPPGTGLVPTGAKLLYVYLIAASLVAAGIALSTVRRRYVYQLAR